jgi:hypothetical protein
VQVGSPAEAADRFGKSFQGLGTTLDSHSLQIPLGLDNPIQVAYHPEIKVFAVGCLREEPPNAGGTITSSFKLIDALNYEREWIRFISKLIQ